MDKYLILTSSGGAGHLTVAKAQKEALLAEGVSLNDITMIDVMGLEKSADNDTPWVPEYRVPGTNTVLFSGPANTERWNAAQKMGGVHGVRKLEELIQYQPLAERIQRPYLTEKLKDFLDKHPDVEHIIDTQALSTEDICHVVAEANETRDKTVHITKIISEFVTEKAVHYFKPLSRVKAGEAQYLTVQTVNPPLTIGDETEAAFYARNHVEHIRFGRLTAKPLRKEFTENHCGTVTVQTHADGGLYEKAFMQKALSNADYADDGKTQHLSFEKQPKDKVVTLTLGSQSSVAIFDYIDAFIEETLAANLEPHARQFLFITTSKNDGSAQTMYAKARAHLAKRMAELEAAHITWPDSAQVIPLAFQDAKSMASLFQNSDVLVARSGGISSMEIEATQALAPNRRVYIHSEAAPKKPTLFPRTNPDACYDTLLPGTVRWEGGNAQYLIHNCGAALTCPSTVLFGLDGAQHTTRYQDSILGLANQGLLNTTHLAAIETSLKHGSNPNLEVIGGLPAIAHAKDEATLKRLIQYGGKLTRRVEENLLETGVITQDSLKSLRDERAQVKAEKKSSGAPQAVQEAFKNAVQDGDVRVVEGLLHRYPKLSSIKDEQLQYPAEDKHIKMLIQHARGIPMLSLQLAQQNDKSSAPMLMRLIYEHQSELNTQDTAHKTPLSYCQDEKLRQLMITLGADPRYLADTVDKAERTALELLFKINKQKKHALHKKILDAFEDYKDCPEAFRYRVQDVLEETADAAPVSREIILQAFHELQDAETKVAAMNIIERFVNFVQYLFSADKLTEHAYSASKKLMFYQDAPEADVDTPDNRFKPEL